MDIAAPPLDQTLAPPLTDRRAPVILIATANEDEGARHLRSLAVELNDIAAALDSAQREGICEVVTLPDATPEQVVQTFQNESYRDRIAILHFAGHAGPEGLLFETGQGSTAVADAKGLAEFLGCQRGLQLVVLNACATQTHVDSLRDAGVGAVVATSRTVEDAIAHQFAVLLYQGLGGGAGIKRAYDEAAAGVRFKHGAIARGSTAESMHASAEAASVSGATSRAIVRKGAAVTNDGRWPWDLYFRPGAEESVGPWALPDAAGNPLFGLPKPPETDQLLTEPFRHLRPFTRAHAELFFGRGKDIRELYDKVTSAASESVMLLYGATGVGKSSLLDAGLLPRLTGTHEVRYAARDRMLGLLGTMAQALGVEAVGAGEAAAVVEGWRSLEAKCGRPLFVVIDQVEEAYTGEDAGRAPPGAGARELDAFAAAIGRLFANPADRPRGRLVLGFRKEWLSEVKGALEAHRVARTEHRLDQLTRGGVLEAITGPTRLAARRMPTRLEIEPGLDVLIADDLLAKRASHVAPLLQILLATMWAEAPRRGDVVRFDAALYESVQAKSKQLDKFLDQQLDALKAWNPEVVDSGLVLDFLRYYTTPKGSSDEHSSEEEAARYPNANEVPPGLRAMCARLFLLVERIDESGAPLPGRPARLAHDTIAPIVRERFERSDLPGPRAKRILDGRSAEWKDGKVGTPLDSEDLRLVEEGERGMRVWNDEELALIKASRVARERAQRRRTWAIRGAIAAVVLIAGFGVGSWVLYKQSQARLAQSTSQELSSRALLADDGRRDIGLLYGVAAYERAPTFEARRSLFSQLARDPYLIRAATISGDQLTFARDGRLLFRQADGVYALDIATGDEVQVQSIPVDSVRAELTLDRSGTVYSAAVKHDQDAGLYTIGVWEIATGRELGRLVIPAVDDPVSWSVGPPNETGARTVAAADANDVVLWDLASGTVQRRLRGHTARVLRSEFSADGSIVTTVGDDGRVIVWDAATGRKLRTAAVKVDAGPEATTEVAISRNNELLAVVASDTLTLWEIGTQTPPRRLGGSTLGKVAFVRNDSSVAVTSADSTVLVYQIESDRADRALGPPTHTLYAGSAGLGLVGNAAGNLVAAMGYDNIARVWDLSRKPLEVLTDLPVSESGLLTALSPDGRFAVEESDSALVVWDVEAKRAIGRATLVRTDSMRRAMSAAAVGANGSIIAGPSPQPDGRGPRSVFDATTGRLIRVVDPGPHAAIALDPVNARLAYGLAGRRAVVVQNLDALGSADTLDLGDPPGDVVDFGYYVDSADAARVVFSPVGDVLVAQTDELTVAVWDLSTRTLRKLMDDVEFRAEALVVSGDGSTIAGVSSSVVKFWRMNQGKPIAKFRWLNWTTAVALSPDGSIFAYDYGRELGVVDVARAGLLGIVAVPEGSSGVLAFSADGRAVLSAGNGGSVTRLATHPDEWIARACAIASGVRAIVRWGDDAPAGATPPQRCSAWEQAPVREQPPTP